MILKQPAEARDLMIAPKSALACSILVLLLLATGPTIAAVGYRASSRSGPELVPTRVCACASDAGGSLTLPYLRGHGQPNQANYDEQLGITFAQSFTSLEYNVTAVEQTDPTLDTGPAYLLNGLSNNGFWYQVGVSWNWGPGQEPGTGFDMNYEVFDSIGNSVFPANGGGLTAFSGTVNEGDIVVLNLYFNNSSQVVMLAEDLTTGAYAQQVYSAEGSSYFTGLPNAIANSNGFFTGLMTEWYHGAPYYSNLQSTVYTTNLGISSGWMWMDEYNPNNNVAVFAANATAASSFAANPAALQEFAYNGTTEYSSGAEFVSGLLPSGVTTTTTSSSGSSTGSSTLVPITFSYSVAGGEGYGAPVFTYISQGSQEEVSLGTTPTAYLVDPGSQWSVSSELPGSSSSERWVTSDTVSGTATSAQSIVLSYQAQYNVTVGSNAPYGGFVGPASSEWYDQGKQVTLNATAYQNWAFEGWFINGLSLAASSGSTIVVVVEQPINATALFYPGLVISAPGSVSITYSYPVSNSSASGAVEGTVSPGTSDEIYVPPTTAITLKATPTSFLYIFTGWLHVQTSAAIIVFSITAPSSITGESGINYLSMGILVVGIALIVSIFLIVARRYRGTEPASTEPQAGPSPDFGQPAP